MEGHHVDLPAAIHSSTATTTVCFPCNIRSVQGPHLPHPQPISGDWDRKYVCTLPKNNKPQKKVPF